MAGSSGISPRKLMAMGKKPAKKQGVKKKVVMRRDGSGKKKT